MINIVLRENYVRREESVELYEDRVKECWKRTFGVV